jgi:hypothetical protein
MLLTAHFFFFFFFLATFFSLLRQVPQFRPMEGARVLSQLLANVTYPFAPPLPSDDELLAYSAADFNAEIDTWTDAAKAQVD